MTRASFLAWLGLAPQTRTGVESMRAPSDGVYASIGGLSGMATIEAPLALVLENGRLILRSTATTSAKPRTRNEILTQSTSNPLQYALRVAAVPSSIEVWRAGIHQYTTATPLPDFTITGPNLITFSSHYAGAVSVQVYANYDPA